MTADSQAALAALDAEVVACRRCPRLVEWRERVARREARGRIADETYWGRPITGFGDPAARILVLGLAPRRTAATAPAASSPATARATGCSARCGAAGFANQPQSVSRDDGLELRGAYVTAAVRCAPPANKPLPAERDACLPYLVRELELLRDVRVIVCLGGFAWDAALRAPRRARRADAAPKPRFGHGAELPSADGLALLGCYHPSQQNTFTGRLTEPMIDAVFVRARELALSRRC